MSGSDQRAGAAPFELGGARDCACPDHGDRDGSLILAQSTILLQRSLWQPTAAVLWKGGAVTASADFEDLGSAFQDAESESWSVRAAAGRALADHAEVDDAARILHLLLLDGRDTAVTQETAEALLQRGDVLGLRLVLKALAVAADPNVPDWDASTMDEIDAAITSDLRWTTEDGWVRLGAQLLELTADAEVAEEANRLRDRMRRLSSSKWHSVGSDWCCSTGQPPLAPVRDRAPCN